MPFAPPAIYFPPPYVTVLIAFDPKLFEIDLQYLLSSDVEMMPAAPTATYKLLPSYMIELIELDPNLLLDKVHVIPSGEVAT
jgi:hypothetical protein